MSELTGQIGMDFGGGATAADAAYYDEAGNLLPEPRTPEHVVDVDQRLGVLAGEINLLEHQARETFKATAVQIGQRLIEAQGYVQKGRWGEWLENNIHYSTRKAQQLMQVAEAYAGKELPESYDGLSFTQIYDLLAAPAEERDALAAQAVEEGLSTRQLKERIRALEEQKQADNRKIYDLLQESEAAERNLRRQSELTEEAQTQAWKAEMTAEELRRASANAVEKANRAEQLADAQKKRAEQAEAAAEKSAAQAADAIQRANATAGELQAAREAMAALENRAPETVEVVPEAVTAELQDLRRQLAEAQAQAAKPAEDGQARAVLALNLQVRLAIANIKDQYAKAEKAVEGLQKLDNEQAEARLSELVSVGAWISDEAGTK